MTNHLGAVEKSEHGPTEARAQRLFDGTDCFTAECLLKAAVGGSCKAPDPPRSCGAQGEGNAADALECPP